MQRWFNAAQSNSCQRPQTCVVKLLLLPGGPPSGPQQNDDDSSPNRPRKRYFYHVVLGLTLGTKFGSAGLSRRENLMDKELHFPSLHSLIEEFDESYRHCGHRLVKVRIGKLVTHDPYSIGPVPWKGVTIHPRTEEAKEAKLKVDRFSKELKSFLRSGGANLSGGAGGRL